MKKKLIIVGASGFGRECFSLAQQLANSENCTWEPVGFLDDREGTLVGKVHRDVPILGAPESYAPTSEERFIIAIGDPLQRRRYAEMFFTKGANFEVLISQRSIISKGVTIGAGSIISAFSLISCDVSIGRHTYLFDHATVSHDVVLGRCSLISSHVFVGGGVQIGDCVTVHPHATILPGTVVEDGATVGAGSVVLSRVHAGDTVFGVPARVVRA